MNSRQSSATRRGRGSGIALMLGGSLSNQLGASLGAMAFPAIGPIGVVAVRQLVMAVVLVPLIRPRLRGLRAEQWRPVLGLVLVFSVMNLGLYAAIERIGLGLAVTLEFLGPLAVAVAGSRRRLDIGCALLAGVGVVVLTQPGPSTDLLGISFALCAAAAWAAYILLNRSVGRLLPGLQGTAVAGAATAAVWLPIATVWFAVHPPSVGALLLAAACGILSSIVPYAIDLAVLRRIPAQLFGTLQSVHPVWAALVGWLLLGQALEVSEWCGIALIVVSNLFVSLRPESLGRRHIAPRPAARAGNTPRDRELH